MTATPGAGDPAHERGGPVDAHERAHGPADGREGRPREARPQDFGGPPPGGDWDPPGFGGGEAPPASSGPWGARAPDLSALIVLLEGLRRLVPAELQHQFTALLREVLLTLRALIDWYLERLEGGRREPEVEEIPID